MGGSIDMNVGVFWETSVGFLKNAVVQLYANLKVKVGQNNQLLTNRQVVLMFSI